MEIPGEQHLTGFPRLSALCVVDSAVVGQIRNSSSGDCYGKADRPLELLVGNH